MSRSKYKGPFFKVNLLKKTKNKEEKNNWKIYNKNLIILPEYKDEFIRVYTGKIFVNLKIHERMVGYKFGEFIHTRKRHIYKKKNKKN